MVYTAYIIMTSLSIYFSTVREYSSLAICKQQFKLHTEDLLTELCLRPSVMLVSTGGNENMGFVV